MIQTRDPKQRDGITNPRWVRSKWKEYDSVSGKMYLRDGVQPEPSSIVLRERKWGKQVIVVKSNRVSLECLRSLQILVGQIKTKGRIVTAESIRGYADCRRTQRRVQFGGSREWRRVGWQGCVD